MILQEATQTETNCTIANKQFEIKNSPIAFDILSSKLYSDSILAIVRELLCNAYDSHKLAGTLHIPIDVHFPDYIDSNFSIRDYGTGLSKEDVMDMYTTFFSSTKTFTNDFTGCFGLGSKTPFSYAPAFSVNSYWNGRKYYFAAVKVDGYPSIYLVKEEPTIEHNGLEVIIPTDNDYSFYIKACEYVKYIPELKIDANKTLPQLKCIYSNNSIHIYETGSYADYVLIKQGQNTFQIDDSLLNYSKILKITSIALGNYTIVYEVPIGTLDITPSRENLDKSNKNIGIITEILQEIEKHITYLFNNKSDTFILTDNIYEKIISNKYFPNNSVSLKITGNFVYQIDMLKMHIKQFVPNHNRLMLKYKHYIFCGSTETTTTHLVLMPDESYTKEYKQLRKICSNIETKNIYFIFVEKSYLKTYRNLKNIEFILNNMHECSVNIKLHTLRQFIENNKDSLKVDSSTKKSENRRIRFTSHSFKNSSTPLQSINYSKGYQEQPKNIKALKENYFPCNTFIINSKVSGITWYDKYFIFDFIRNGCMLTKDNKNPIKDYYSKIDFKSEYLNFLEIAPSNMKYFKEYDVFDINEFYELIKKHNFTVMLFDNKSGNKSNKYVFKNLTKILSQSFKNNELQFIKNTKLYQKYEKLSKLPYYNIHSDNVISNNTLDIIKNFDNISILDMTHKFIIPFNDIKQLIKYISSKINEHKNNVNYIPKQYKNNVLRIFRGEKNVLF